MDIERVEILRGPQGTLFGCNLTDEDEQIQGIDFSMFRSANWQEPRTYMFTAAYNC